MPEAPRIPEAEVDPLFVARWSPRAFTDDKLTDAQIRSLFEAARWAPSSANQQPWLFLYATGGPDLEVFQSLLTPGNAWAKRAPLLGYVFTNKISQRGGENPTAELDAGAAWMSLALRAWQLGLFAHGMGGFDHEGIYAALRLPREKYKALAAFAVGRHGDPATLTPEQREREKPSPRKPLAEVAHLGVFDR